MVMSYFPMIRIPQKSIFMPLQVGLRPGASPGQTFAAAWKGVSAAFKTDDMRRWRCLPAASLTQVLQQKESKMTMNWPIIQRQVMGLT
jgi:hypothetical protein